MARLITEQQRDRRPARHARSRSRARGRRPIRRVEPEAADLSSSRFVAGAARRGCFTNQRHWLQGTTAWRAAGNGRVRRAPEGLRGVRLIDLSRREPVRLALDHKQFPVRHLCETASVPSSSDADDELDAPSLEIAEEPALACDRANSAARRHPADCFSRCRRRSRQSQSRQRRDCEPGALLLLERGASHESAGRRPRRGEDLYECNVSDRQCCGEPARSLLGPARPGIAQLEPAAGARALGAVYQARADARARRTRF